MVVIPSCCAARLRCTRIASESVLRGQQSWPVPPVWGVRIDIVSVMSSISAFLTDLKEFKLHTVYFGASEQIKLLQPIGQAAEFKFESKFEPLQVIWQSLPTAIPEDNRRFRGQNQWPSS